MTDEMRRLLTDLHTLSDRVGRTNVLLSQDLHQALYTLDALLAAPAPQRWPDAREQDGPAKGAIVLVKSCHGAYHVRSFDGIYWRNTETGEVDRVPVDCWWPLPPDLPMTPPSDERTR